MSVPGSHVSRRDFLRMRLLQDASPKEQFEAFTISGECLVFNSVYCRSCGDACQARAIRFVPEPCGQASIRVDESLCDDCGACAEVCPVGALAPLRQQENAGGAHG